MRTLILFLSKIEVHLTLYLFEFNKTINKIMLSKKLYNNIFHKIPLAMALFGILLAITQFIYNRSLWGDEAMLAYGIVNTPFSKIHLSLPYHQVSPWLYLVICKIFYCIYSSSEMSLRFISIIAYVLSVRFFYISIKEIFKNEIPMQIVSMGLFVFNSFLIYYSSELKHYSLDVLVASYYLYAYACGVFTRKNGALALIISSIISIMISSSIYMVLPSAIILIILDKRNLKKSYLFLRFPIVFIGSFFILYYFIFISRFDDNEFMKTYWSHKETAFMPLNIFSLNFFEFMYDKQIMFFEYVFRLGFIVSIFLRIIFVLGIASCIYMKDWRILILALMPLLIHLILSSLMLFPFHIRFCLYLIPTIIILYLKGLLLFSNHRKTKILKSNGFALFSILILFLGFMGFKVNGFPIQKHEVRLNYKKILSNCTNNDLLIIHEGNIPAWRYYRESGIIKSDNTPETYFFDNEHDIAIDVSSMLKRGRKVWFLKDFYSETIVRIIENELTLSGYQKIESSNSTGTALDVYVLR